MPKIDFRNLNREELLAYFIKNKDKYSLKTDKSQKLEKYTEAIITRNRCPFSIKELYKNPLVWSFGSVMNQTYLPKEIIILNDCSEASPLDYTEEVIEILKQQCTKKEIKFVYYKNAAHKNLAESRNIALNLSKNKLIHFLDDDCILYPEALGGAVYLFGEVRKTDDKIAILNLAQAARSSHPVRVSSAEKMSKINMESLELTGSVSATFPIEYFDIPPYYGKENKILKPLTLENFQAGNMLVDRDILLEMGGFIDYHSLVSYAEDSGLVIKLLKKGFKVYYFPYLNLHAAHMSFGNSGSLHEFFGIDWLDKENNEGYNLKQMVAESIKFREGSGCRVRKEIYFYVKIRNFAIMLEDFKKGLAEKWAKKTYENFVEENKIEFQDKKGSIEEKSIRRKIWKQAIEDAENNTSFKNIEEFLIFLKS